jgi:hypothetical protein
MPTPLRTPDISTHPQHAGGAASQYTEYKLRSLEDRKQARADVLRVAGNRSFVSKTLLIISRHGASKNFVTITGEDGLTFGTKDFISGSLLPLVEAVEVRVPLERVAWLIGSQMQPRLSGLIPEKKPLSGASSAITPCATPATICQKPSTYCIVALAMKMARCPLPTILGTAAGVCSNFSRPFHGQTGGNSRNSEGLPLARKNSTKAALTKPSPEDRDHIPKSSGDCRNLPFPWKQKAPINPFRA